MSGNQDVGTPTLKIRPAKADDLPALLELRAACIRAVTSGYDTATLEHWLQFDPSDRYLDTIRVKNLLVACGDGAVLGCAGLHLPGRLLIATFVHPDGAGMGIGRRLLAGVEDRAREFGLPELLVESALNATAFYQSCGYVPDDASGVTCSQRTGMDVSALQKSLSPGFNDNQLRILVLLKSLGIPGDYGVTHQLSIHDEATELVDIGKDVFDRQQVMAPQAAAAWQQMQNAAAANNVDLLPVSAFRTVEYQADLIRRKVTSGQAIVDILQVSAAPGFSEHHSGQAIDIASCSDNVLDECFEQTRSFEWLTEHAGNYGFNLSYPRDNPHGIAYEPWHWAWRLGRGAPD